MSASSSRRSRSGWASGRKGGTGGTPATLVQLEDRQDVSGGVAEPGDRRTVLAHDPLVVLAAVLVDLERDAALHQGLDGRVDVVDREVEHRVVRRLVAGLGIHERR